MRPAQFFALVQENRAEAVRAALERDRSLLEAFQGGHQPLHAAAEAGHAAVADVLIEHGADVRRKNGWGWTPIVLAAYHNRLEAVRGLLAAGAKADAEGGNPIHYAGQQGNREVCRLLVEHGAADRLVSGEDPDARAVFRAAYAYDAPALRELLARRPELANARDKDGRVPLHEAATFGAVEVLRALIDAGADVNAEDEEEETPLIRAAAHGQEKAARTLLEAGARVDLFSAVRRNIVQEARRILEEEPSLVHMERSGHALTEWAAEAGFVEMGRLLAEFGAEIDIHAASSFGFLEEAERLLDAEPELANAERGMGGYAPLHAAAECGHLEVCALLIRRGADVDRRNAWGFRPLHLSVLAARGHRPTEAHLAISRLLLESGADPNPEDDYRRTPLSLAEGHWTKGAVERELIALLKRGDAGA